jgi:predicted metalloendopeptidase
MKKRLFVVSSFFVACVALAGCGGGKNASSSSNTASSSDTSSNSTTPVADGAVLAAAKKIATNAGRDGMSVTANGLLSACGYSGTEALTKTRGFNLLYKAYQAGMPEMVGQRKYGAYVITIPYTGVPDEATEAVKFLSDHGLLVKEVDSTGADISVFNGDEDFTSNLSLYLDRFHAYCGTSLHDDFANTVNHDFLYANQPYLNKTTTDIFSDTNLVSQSKLDTWVDNHINAMTDGTDKTNLLTYKSSFEDETLKGAGVCAGAYNSYEAIANAADYSSLFSGCASLFTKSGNDPLFSTLTFNAETQFANKNFGILDVPLESQYTVDNFKAGTELYTNFVSEKTAVFKAVGFAEGTAENFANYFASFTADLAAQYAVTLTAAKATTDIPNMVETTQNVGTVAFNLQDHLTAGGFTMAPFDLALLSPSYAGHYASRFLAKRTYAYSAYFAAMNDGNFGGVKAAVLYNQISAFLPCNPLAAVTHLGYDSNYLQSDEIRANFFNPEVGRGLIKDYKETANYRNNLALISKAIVDLRLALKSRIATESWLSDAGKKAAIAKVEAVKTSILANNDNGTGIDLTMPTFTTSLYDNIASSKRIYWNTALQCDDTSFYPNQNLGDPFTANAFYTPWCNGITILFGYLAAHDDFTTMSQEKIFSDLYLACGHELTHGFDTNGVGFDENGKKDSAWWSEADHAAYTARVQSVIDFYQGDEVLPGLATVGTTVISEACADFAGAVLTMDLAAKIPTLITVPSSKMRLISL